MPMPAHFSTASALTHQRMTAAWRSGSGSGSTTAASLGCMAVIREQTHPVASRSTSTPTGRPATAMATTSPECASEKAGTGASWLASTGLPDGPPQVGQGSRANTRRPGSLPRWPARTRRSITCAAWYRCRSAGYTNAAALAVSLTSRSVRSAGPSVTSLTSNQETSAARSAPGCRDALLGARLSETAGISSPPGNERSERAQGGQRVEVQVLGGHVNAVAAADLAEQQRAGERVEAHRVPEQRCVRRDAGQLGPAGKAGQHGTYLARDRPGRIAATRLADTRRDTPRLATARLPRRGYPGRQLGQRAAHVPAEHGDRASA